MPSNICFPNISKPQSLQRRATSKDWSLQDPPAMIGKCCSLNSGQLSFETLPLLCYQSMREMEKVVDLDIDTFNSSEMGVPSPGNVSRQNVQAEYTNKLKHMYPSSRNQICF